jgi:hypothetical protein
MSCRFRLVLFVPTALLLVLACSSAATVADGADGGDGTGAGGNGGADGSAATEVGSATDGDGASTGDAASGDAAVDPGCADAGPYGGRTFTTAASPLHITAGGTYQDLIVTSPDSDTAAIMVDTSDPVIIQYVRGSGAGDFVHASDGANVTVRNSIYTGAMPTRDNVRPGRFFATHGPKNVVIEHCVMEHTSGIEVQSFAGDGSPAQTVVVRYNDAREIDGRFRNGGSEFQDFVGLNAGNRASAEISYNRVVTTPGQGRAEDNITMYKNGGTAARPYRVYRNYIEGSFPDAFLDDATTGTAINCDGDQATTDTDFPQYGIWEENVATGGAAINVAVGRHMRVNRNTVVSVGRNRFGTRYRSGNAGVSFFNYIGSGLWGDNTGDGNRILWLSDNGSVTNGTPYSATRRDVDQGAASLTNTVALNLPYATAEQSAYDDYVKLVASAGVSIGVSWCK